jgi:protein TonB
MSATIMHRPRYQGTGRAQSLVGWAVVIAIHLLILWALVTGTARRSLETIKKKPLEAAVIQEVIIPPAPPPPPPP